MDDWECFPDLAREETFVIVRVDVQQDRALPLVNEVEIVVVSVLFDNVNPLLEGGPFEVSVTHLFDDRFLQLAEPRYYSLQEIIMRLFQLYQTKHGC